MKFSEKWLRERVDPPVGTQQLAEQLTMAGLEVESVDPCATGFSGIISARVLEVKAHPGSEGLSVCQVDTGKQKATVVCGARNVSVGGCYPYAPPGSSLPGGKNIDALEIRGVKSTGMLCSGMELGLSDDADGIMELGGEVQPGLNLEDLLGLDDQLFALSLTPNRGDCLSIEGLAREIAAINDVILQDWQAAAQPAGSEQTFAVTLADPQACPRYAGRVISGVDPSAPSPTWLTEKLRRSGVRSINCVVDVTNYVMLELGQPMHAFDLEKLHEGITVRKARQGEQLAILDGTTQTLTADTLVIADARGAVAMAGIMGGLASGVTESTATVFLESAFFSPAAIMGKARQYGLHTDSSHRFERGVDPTIQVQAVERATELILAIAGGTAGPVTDQLDAASLPPQPTVLLRQARVGRLLGFEIAPAEVAAILQRLNMKVKTVANGWEVSPPPFRFDIQREADLIEEIVRIHGYNQVPSAAIMANLRVHQQDDSIDINKLRDILENRDYHEVLTYSFVDAAHQDAILGNNIKVLPLLNPISTDLAVMRASLWPGLLSTLQYNHKRQQGRVRIYEVGQVFSRHGEAINQTRYLAGLIYGNRYNIQWDIENTLCDFFDIKGDVEALLSSRHGGNGYVFQPADNHTLHPGRSAGIYLDNQVIGYCGELHPRLIQRFDLPHPAYVFELNIADLSTKMPVEFQKISKFPAVKRDISVVLDRKIAVADVLARIHATASDSLNNLELFDVYHGEGIDILKKSLALGLTFQASSSTLTDEEVEGEVEKIVSTLRSEFGGKLRE